MVRRVAVSPDGHLLQHEDGTPFFWLGDTGWLLFTRLSREEAEIYLEDRRRKGFNVIQVMAVPGLPCTNAYGHEPFADMDPGRPVTTSGGYWDHVDFVLSLAAEKGMHLAMVPAWGSVVKRRRLHPGNAAPYGTWLGDRYRDRPNVIWLNGGDVHGDRYAEVWAALAEAIKRADPGHLITFHPFGRTQSSQWFHDASWLDLNMCQSGHQRYDQTAPGDGPGEDNWRYIAADYARVPAKPTLDGEPSYEGIPQGLHDPNEPVWQDRDSRRYAYWSVFAGACGHTYGNGSVMQMLAPRYAPGGYGVTRFWYDAMRDPGAGQMQYLKNLLLSRPYFERRPEECIVAGDQGERYDRLLATRGDHYAFIYTYTGRPFVANLREVSGERVHAWWYNPRDGDARSIGELGDTGRTRFVPPGAPTEGNDWVLVLDDADRGYRAPGEPVFPGLKSG